MFRNAPVDSLILEFPDDARRYSVSKWRITLEYRGVGWKLITSLGKYFP